MISKFNYHTFQVVLHHFIFYPLEIVSRYRDPHIQVGEYYSFFLFLDKKIQMSMWKHKIYRQMGVIYSVNKMEQKRYSAEIDLRRQNTADSED